MWIVGVLSLIYAAYKIISEKLEKPAPANRRFDWDAYWKDVENGMSVTDGIKKQKRGDYWTTKPENNLVDIERYEHDKKYFGEECADGWRKNGYYKTKLDYYDNYKHKFITNR